MNNNEQIPTDLFGNRKLQALAKKNHIQLKELSRFNRYGKIVYGRVVAEKDLPRWCEVLHAQRRAEIDRVFGPFERAVAGTRMASLLEGIDRSNRTTFETELFRRLIDRPELAAGGLDYELKQDQVRISGRHVVKAFGETVVVHNSLVLRLPQFVRQLARGKSDSRCVATWTKRIVDGLKLMLAQLDESTARIPGVDLLTTQFKLNEIIADEHLISMCLDVLHDRIAKAARSALESKVANGLSNDDKFSDYLSSFPRSRIREGRRIIAFVGPTNSGKTYEALERLALARRGTYLAPLRLLALENRDALKDRGIRCSLITGEEQVIQSGDTHSSRTVEMADFIERMDVAVIDEFQLVLDGDRGWAWVAAYCGINAPEVVLAGSPAAMPAIEALARMCGDELEVRRFERQSPLQVQPILMLENLPEHSAVICFSRNMVLEVRELLQSRGVPCSVIYGDLSPEVRREEARRFRDGETKVVVATDAIGMGLNLPILTLAFWETDKFDGKEDRPLTPAEIHQIAGRAGRGKACGSISTFSERDHCRIVRALDIAPPIPSVDKLNAGPTLFHLNAIAQELEEDRLAILLDFYLRRTTLKNPFLVPAVSEQIQLLAKKLDTVSVRRGLCERFHWLHVPVKVDDEYLLKECMEYFQMFCENRQCPAPQLPTSWESLTQMESAYRRLKLYLWLAQRFPVNFVDGEKARDQINQMNHLILDWLRNSRGGRGGERKECIDCGRAVLPSSDYATCWACHEAAQWAAGRCP